MSPSLAFEVSLPGQVVEFVPGNAPLQGDVDITFVVGAQNYHPSLKGKVVIFERNLECIRGLKNYPVEIVNPVSDQIYNEVAWKYLFCSYEVIGDDPKISEYMDGVSLVASDKRDFGVQVYVNLRANMQSRVRNLRGKLWGVPAIVCGAGPSLDEDLERLKELNDRAVIFAGGSALAPLARAGVHVHFGGAVDPDPPPERFRGAVQFEMPLLYQNRVSHQLFSEHHGEKLLFGQNDPLEEALVGGERFDGGWLVSNFLVHAALEMGCAPVVIVGMDGCWTPGREYVKGVEGLQKGQMRAQDRFGNEVLTRRDLFWGAHWFSQLQGELINANRGGLPIAGWKEKTLDQLNFPQWDLQGLIASLERVEEDVSFEGIERFEQEIKEAHSLADQWANALIKESNEAILFGVELRELKVYEQLLSGLWQMFQPLFAREKTPIEISEALFYKKVTMSFAK
ncbi:MAG: DUF115 domain-containing protein [Simkaniaceae bacterium]|nr:DUF115 domain-containing protein [Simkaniaceae bacterium]